ncbi:MAG: drug/metabolite exporter YedA [Acidobacteria bacterium]|nr:MAG: drug/metabolite exporter YedA [Acidobacteriota bacterium]
MKTGRPPSWQILLAFATIYFVWGSTFLAIRVGVRELPPLLFAAMRFFAAGVILYVWMRLKGSPPLARREWLGASVLGALIFVVDYGCLFWAEQRVPSGIAAVILATIPVFITLSEIIFLRTQRLTARLALALLVGIGGVAVLMSHSESLGEAPVNRAGAAALLIAAVTWSIATILTKRMPLPASKPMSAAAQMLSGGILLFVAAWIFGEMRGVHIASMSAGAWFSLIYLIFAGSIAGFTAYIWLLHYESPTKVGTYAYVNPVVAVALGHFLGGESVGARTLLGTLLVLVSVIAITTMPARRTLEPESRQVEAEELATVPSSSPASSTDRIPRP